MALNLDIGLYGFFYSAFSLFMLIISYIDLGFNQSATILIAKHLAQKEHLKTKYTFWALIRIKFLFGFHFKSFLAIPKAHISFYKNLSNLRRKRNEIQKNVVIKKHPEIYSRSIMWKFFILNKKKYSDLNFQPE
jgi:hypothetical protein